MADLDFIEEIRIAQFWRKQLGEYEYVNHNPDDLRRWYVAMETRGPDEIRDYLIERTGRHPPAMITGIVGIAPHPPREIVDLWLKSHDKINTAPLWYGGCAFLLACTMLGTNLVGCSNLRSLNNVANNPPAAATIQPGFPQNAPPAASTAPANLPVPAHQASPPTGSLGPGQSQQP